MKNVCHQKDVVLLLKSWLDLLDEKEKGYYYL